MSERNFKPSEVVKTSTGRQYHINLTPGELAGTILLCVDPKRAKRVASSFDTVSLESSSREYQTYAGVLDGNPISVFGTGIGQDNTAIFFVEAVQLSAAFI